MTSKKKGVYIVKNYRTKQKPKEMESRFGGLLQKAYNFYLRVINHWSYLLKIKCNGMLPPSVYKKIYEAVYELPDLDIIEIGGAAGAGSIATALAMKESNKKSRLIVIEKCEGGSRSEFGRYQENLNLINSNFKEFEVENNVLLYPHELTFENGEDVISLVKTPNIAALIHDADGRIDRDFYLFWPIIKPGGLIIIDDYTNTVKFKPISEQYPQGGVKGLQTYRLLNQFMEWGLFKPLLKMDNTIFGYKPPNSDFSLFDMVVCKNIIKEVHDERLEYIGQKPKSIL